MKSFMKKPHEYKFRVYALDTMLDGTGNENKKDILKLMQCHIIEYVDYIGIGHNKRYY